MHLAPESGRHSRQRCDTTSRQSLLDSISRTDLWTGRPRHDETRQSELVLAILARYRAILDRHRERIVHPVTLLPPRMRMGEDSKDEHNSLRASVRHSSRP